MGRFACPIPRSELRDEICICDALANPVDIAKRSRLKQFLHRHRGSLRGDLLVRTICWRQVTTWLGIGLLGLIILATALVVVRQSFATGFGWAGVPVVCIATVVIAFGTYKAIAPVPEAESPTERLSRRLWVIGGVTFAAVSVLAGIFSTLGQLSPPVQARILERIPGRWGESDCAITFRFTVRDNALIVDSDRRPPSQPPYRLIATIVRAQGDVMEVRGEAPAAANGKAATFTYSTNGVSEQLMWNDRVSSVPSQYRRCGRS